jgi:protein phosphatase
MATTALAKHFDATEAEYAPRPEVDQFGLWTAARRLSAGVQKANAAVIEIARTANKYRGMGTTLVACVLVPETGRLHVAHVGDSRCYRLRHGELELLTPDHSILNDVLELYPELDDPAIQRLPRKAITRALGMEERVRVAVRTLRARPGDRYLLCSDGITGELGEGVIASLLGEAASPADIVRDLVRAAREMGGRDNITALVIECRSLAPGQKPVRPPRRPSTARMTAVRPEPSVPAATAPDAPAAPAPPSSRAKPKAPPPDPVVEITGLTEVSVPEIVLMRPADPHEGSEPRISVVPMNSADAQTIRALDSVAGALGATQTECARCGAKLGGAIVCPRCGYSDAEAVAKRT